MSNLMMTKSVTIGGVDYQLSPLSVAEARPILAILQKCVGVLEVSKGSTQDLVVTSMVGGLISEQDFDVMVKAFGAKTIATIQTDRDSRTLVLNKPAVFDELFSTQFELIYAWVDACIDFNFASTLAKLKAVVAATVEYAKAASKSPQD